MKTPGQVAYEKMLEILRRECVYSEGIESLEQRVRDHIMGKWEAQEQKLRDDWEEVAQAVIDWLRTQQ